MKTSAPTICSTACSPLTARLSMTMSLYGRRPSVVLSLVICTSLITTPSSDTTSLPMYDLAPRYRVSCLAASAFAPSAVPSLVVVVNLSLEGPPRARRTAGTAHSREYHRNIILSTGIVGGIDQRARRLFQRVVTLQQLGNALVIEHVGQAVGAQQVDIARHQVVQVR